MKVGIIAIIVICALTVSSCTTSIKTRKLIQNEPAPPGYPYRLKFTQFAVKIKWQAVACERKAKNPLKIKISATATPKTTFDPDQFYIVDPSPLAGLFKASEVNFEWYIDRTLKSINSTSDDQTGQAIGNVITGIGKLAAVALASAAPAPGTPLVDPCDSTFAKSLPPIEKAKKNIAAVGIVVKQKTARVAQVTATAATLGASIDSGTRQALASAIAELEAEALKLDIAKSELEDLLKDVTYEQDILWPQVGGELAKGPIEFPAETASKWDLAGSGEAKKLSVFLGLRPKEVVPLPNAAPPTKTVTDSAGRSSTSYEWDGLPYREPIWASLEVCSVAPCGDGNSKIVEHFDQLVLQMGPMLLLPFNSQTFASAKSSATFSEGGTLATAGVSQTRSAGVGATEAFKGSAESLSGIWQASNDSQLKRIENKTNLLKAEKALADAKLAKDPVPASGADKQAQIKSLETDVALIVAETNLINAQRALDLAKQQAGL
ncbi:hypothetical protein ACW9ID_16445 [Pseudomonas gingeri]